VHALRNLHEALRPGGVLVDTQPLFTSPRVEADDGGLGTLDMREWRRTVDAVDVFVAEAVAAGLFEPAGERRYSVRETFDNGRECLEIVRGWEGTRVPAALASRLRSTRAPVAVVHDVRLRLFVAV
jgi:hypothetical protein